VGKISKTSEVLLRANIIPAVKKTDKYFHGYKIKQYLSCVDK
jgi:hypothetical protein